MAELERRGPESVRRASTTLQSQDRANKGKSSERLRQTLFEMQQSKTIHAPEAFNPISDRWNSQPLKKTCPAWAQKKTRTRSDDAKDAPRRAKNHDGRLPLQAGS